MFDSKEKQKVSAFVMFDYLQHTNLNLGPVVTSLFLIFATIILLAWNSSRKQSYWKKLGVPYATSILFLGSISYEDIWKKKTFQDIELERYKKYGKIHGHYERNTPLLNVGDPEVIRQILVKDFHAFTGRREVYLGDKIMEKMLSVVRGEDWKKIRTIISPTFSTGKIKRVSGIFKECAQTLVQNFKKSADKGEPVDVKNFYGAFTMDVIASSAFSTKIDSHNDPKNPFVETAREVFTRFISWRIFLFIIVPFFVKMFKISLLPRKAPDFFANVTLQIIEERKRTGQTRNDFLQLLLDTSRESSEDGKLDVDEKDEIAENYRKEEQNQSFKHSLHSKKTLTHDEVIAQCVLFFLAGFDTTASLLTFASYNLALNPDIQEKLIKEVDTVLEENKGKLEYESIQCMKYLDNVISETLRIYPPAIRLERKADQDYKIEDRVLTIPKDIIVTIPVYAIHRDPEFYPEPEKFDPDRFNPEERAKRNPYTYLPFGAGPRNCVAMRFALMEAKICLAYVLSNFRIKKCAQTKVPPEFSFGQGLLQPKDIKLILEPRTEGIKEL